MEADFHVDDVDIDGLIAERVTMGDVGVPPLPAAVARVGQASAGGASLPEVTKLLEADPAVAAGVLRLAKSPAYSSSNADVSLPYAVLRIGVKSVRGVCFTAPLARVALQPGPLLPLRRRVWRECLAAALACESMATFRGAQPDEAYLLGLLHDFGKIVSLCVVEGHLGGGIAGEDAFWRDLMERHHCDVGWVVTDQWRLPSPIPDVTAMHHTTDAPFASPMLDVVKLADDVVALASSHAWQIGADDIARVPGVRSKDEAMALRIAIAKHPYFLTALT